jgi:iron complex transport system ATP-binding protein
MSGAPGLALEKLSGGYRGRLVFSGLSLEAGAGELLVLAGPNGSGKTTLLKTAAGLVKPSSGRVLVKGRDMAALKNRERAALLSFLFQENGPRWPFTVEELVSQGRFYRPPGPDKSGAAPPAMEKSLKAAGLAGFEDRPVTELSGGEYQRALIARALFQGSPVLLLDEPANNLDPQYQLMVMDILKALTAEGATVLVSLHDLNLAARYADRIALLHRGKLAALAPPAGLFRRDILEPVFGVFLETWKQEGERHGNTAGPMV